MNAEMKRYVVSCLCTMAVFVPLLLILRLRFGLRPESEMIVDDAKRHGRVARATLIRKNAVLRTTGSRNGRDMKDRWAVRYEYVVDGIVYHFKGISGSFPENTLTLYYPDGHPEKAIPETLSRAGWRIMILFPAIAAAFVFFYWVVFSKM